MDRWIQEQNTQKKNSISCIPSTQERKLGGALGRHRVQNLQADNSSSTASQLNTQGDGPRHLSSAPGEGEGFWSQGISCLNC